MALHNPPNLYSAGNVVLDSTPYVRMAMAARERKAAREEAVDKYYQNLPNTVNDKGLRDQEVPIVSDYKNKMFDYWVQNRDALRKGDPQALMGLQRLHRGAMSVVREGLNASQNDMKAGQMAMKKENLPVLTSPYFIEKHQKAMLPVTDPNYEPLNLQDILSNRPFDQTGFIKEIKGNFKYGEGTPTITPHPTDKNLEVITTNPMLDDETKKGIYAYAAEKYHSDPTFQIKLNKDYSTPEQLAKLNEISKSTFGHELNEPEDIAAAYTVSQLPTQATKAVVRESIDAKNANREIQRQRDYARSLQKMGYNDQLIKGRMKLGDEYKKTYAKFKSAMDAGEENKVLDSFIDKMDATGKPSAYATYKGEVFRDGKYVQVPIELRDKYTINTSNDPSKPVWESPKNFFLSKDKKTIIPLYYSAEENGKIKLDPSKSVPIPIQNFKLDLSKLLLTKSKTGAEVTDQFTGDENPSLMQSIETGTIEKHPAKKFNIVNPKTGEVMMEGIDEEAAKKAQAKGYKIQ